MSINLSTRNTTLRSGHLCYNRRVPSHAQRAFGPQLRIRIKDQAEAERLTRRLNDLWAEEHVTLPIDLHALLAATAPKRTTLTTIAARYRKTGIFAARRLEARFPLSASISAHMEDFGGAKGIDAVD